MTLKNDTESLSRTLEEMRGKSAALNDSLRRLAAEGFERLEKSVTQSAAQSATRRRSGQDKDAADMARDALFKLLRQELSGSLRDIFSVGGPGGGKSGGLQVVIHNNAGAQVSARETTGAFDQKQLEITIDQMVANSLLRGRQTGGVLRTLFGLAPSLMGR